ncbi:MAG: tRNA uridine-5-carboxymethylaminomethyl(34) synthesis GTPase MnmE [Deltaproteobacteria bacterium]|nr:tRNA uridine-5-carboxymethylaminomethyl(34) synthesis GTPase MnmE [Deltaproteobacteria bacterium]
MTDDLASTGTIAALSTPPGQAGIGIIRISGPSALDIARRIFRSRHPVREWQSHHLHLGVIADPATGAAVDEVLLSVMKAPRSYTREDVVEINSHSGHALLERILNVVLDAGARQARPGEFTLRAFLNGRIDLTQAEAVMDLIRARSERGIELASRQLQGGLKDRLGVVRETLVELLAHTEVAIDYPDEGYGLAPGEEAASRVKAGVLAPLEEIRAAHARGRIWVDGAGVAIVGRVNVGKSSILNRLAGSDRAIVTPEPGTTRDIIEQTVQIDGLPVRLMDTAGYRTVRGAVEEIGIRLAEQCIENADLALWVVDGSHELEEDDLRILQQCRGKPTLAVMNKIDLPARLNEPALMEECGDIQVLPVSALSGEGIEGLAGGIRKTLLAGGRDGDGAAFAPNARQKRGLNEACSLVLQAVDNLRDEAPLEIIALDLQSALSALDEIRGTPAPGDVLDRIFSEFCLGK